LLAREIVAEAKGKEEANILKSQLQRYIQKQYPDDFDVMGSTFNFILYTTGQVTKINPDTLKSRLLSKIDRSEELYIFTMGRLLHPTIFYIVRCAKPEGCPVICSTADDGGIGSVCSKINGGISRPLKGMESEVLRLCVDTIRKDSPPLQAYERGKVSIRFASVNNSKYYIIDFDSKSYETIKKNLTVIDEVNIKKTTTDRQLPLNIFELPDNPYESNT
jgi:hypothetical protein